ncbi:MAG: MFS transporter [Sphingomonas sp.]
MNGQLPHGSLAYRGWMMALLVGVYASSSLDRLILATLAQALKRDLLISDLQFGLLNGVIFAALFTLGGVPIARLADRRRRVPILAAAIGIWSAMTALSALATNFLQLALFRIGVSLGEAGCSPVTYSLISDQYPAKRRAGAVAILGLGVPLGAMMGAVLGGWASETVGWQAAFAIAGVPGLALAAAVWLTLREPPRGSFDPPAAASEAAPSFADVLRHIAARPAYLHLMAVAAICIFCNTALNLFIPSFFIRSHGLGQYEAGKYFGAMIGIGAAVGTGGLGLLISRVAQRDPRWLGWGPALVMALGLPFYLVAFTTQSFSVAYPALFIATCIGFAFLGPVVGGTQNMVPPRMRASAAAVLLIAMHLVGGGLGPSFAGIASDLFAARAFGDGYAVACPAGLPPPGAAQAAVEACATASAHGLRMAMILCSLFFAWGALHAVLAARTIRRDLLAAPSIDTDGPAILQPTRGAA